jgi:hypothetical protein
LIFRDLTACANNDKLFSEVQATFERQLGKQDKKGKKNNFCSIADSIQRLNDMFDWVISLDKIAIRHIVSAENHIVLKRSYESKCVRALRAILPFTCRVHVDSEDSIYRAVCTVRRFFKNHNDDDEDERGILSGPLSCVGLSGVLGRSPQGMATSEIHGQQKRSFVQTTYSRRPTNLSDSDELDSNDGEARSSASISSSQSSTRPRKRAKDTSVHFETSNQDEDTEDIIARSLSVITNKKVDEGFSKVGNDISQIQQSLAEISSLSSLTQQSHSDTTVAVGHLLDGQQTIVKGQRTINDGVQASSKVANRISTRLEEIKNNQGQIKKTLQQSLAAHTKTLAQGLSSHSLLVKNDVPNPNKSSQRDSQERVIGQTDMHTQLKELLKEVIESKSQSQLQRGQQFSAQRQNFSNGQQKYNGPQLPCCICDGDHPFWQHPGLDKGTDCIWEKINSNGQCRTPFYCKMKHLAEYTPE